MTSFPISNQEVGIRMCILSEFLHSNGKLSINDAYNNLCKEIGHDIITYEDFNFWMNRFENRQFDLGVDINFEQNSNLEPKKPKTFSDLPTDVIEKIVDSSELKEQLTLRKVSCGLRSLVNIQKLAYSIIDCQCYSNHILVMYNRRWGSVYLRDDIENISNFDFGLENIKVVKSDDYIADAIRDMSIALSNPKNRLEMLKIDFDEEDEYSSSESGSIETIEKVYEGIENLLKPSENSKLAVRSFMWKPARKESVSMILPYLKSGILESIHIENSNFDCSKEIREMTEMDQWKQVQDVEIYYLPIEISIDKFFHLKKFEIFIQELSIEDFIRMRDALSTSPIFESGSIQYESGMNYGDVFRNQNSLQLVSPKDAESENVFHFHIPNSNLILDFYIDNQSILIEKY